MASNAHKAKGGRPPKFSEPSRPVTLTLPDSTLTRLAYIDPDRAKAVVKAANRSYGEDVSHPMIDVVEVSPGSGIILVGRSAYLGRIPFLRLVEVAPGRFLLVIPSGTPPDSLEVALVDLLEGIPAREVEERKMIRELQALLGTFRRGKRVSKAEILFVDTRT